MRAEKKGAASLQACLLEVPGHFSVACEKLKKV